MGYRGKLKEQDQARALRAQSWTLQEIADKIGVSKSSVSLWVRDVAFVPKPRGNRNYGARKRRPHAQRVAKLAQIESMNRKGTEQIGTMSERDWFVSGVALYAGDGSKRDGTVSFANSNPAMITFFCNWLRRFFDVDETRLRVVLYLHQGLDLKAANSFWSERTGIPVEQFTKPYRAVPDATIRNSKHIYGCAHVVYSCSATHRAIMGLVRALFPAQP